ncbi:MAG: DUF3737 family protein [Clostridia bacterium]|nr:DUF3737 family protein [Clostridia bacterium]
MKNYTEQKFVGERALFQSRDLELSYCTFADGESPLKESRNLEIDHCLFQWKYPIWYSENVEIQDSTMFEMARAGIWYTNHIKLERVTYQAPKGFRRCTDLALTDVTIPNAAETLWNCDQVTMKNVTAKGDYFAMGSTNMNIEDFTLVGNYSFDGAKNLEIRNAKLISKDAFWNSENVIVYDSFISGEYLGWNSKNVTFINCTIESEQGMCYMEQVKLVNCKLLNTNLAFEYSTVEADIDSEIDSVKNPYSGSITANKIGELIFDNPEMNQDDTEIVQKKQMIRQAG